MAYNGMSKPRMSYAGNSPGTRTKGVKPYNSAGKPNYQKGPKADLYKGFRADKNRGGNTPTKQESQKYGMSDNDKSYQMPSEKYTNGKMADTKTPPPKKPKQLYGKPAKSVTVSPSNKRATPKAAGSKFVKTNKMPKAKPITSIAQLRGLAKKGGKKVMTGGY